MHVLILASDRFMAPEIPISGIFQRDQAHALLGQGVDVGVLAPKPRNLRTLFRSSVKRQWGFDSIDDGGVPVEVFRGFIGVPERTPRVYPWAYRRLGRALFRRYVKRHGMPDLIHAHNVFHAGALGVNLKLMHGMPLVLTEHSSAHLRGGMRSRHRAIAKRAFDGADARIAVSPALCRTLEAEYGSPGIEWEWIPNVLSPVFEDQDEDLPIPGNVEAFRLLAVGSLNRVKNHAGLIEAFSEAFGEDPTVELRIIGSGPLRDELLQLARTLGVSERVHLLGYRDRDGVLGEMRSCDAFVLSSTHETFGVALIEALSCGRPVVAIACGGPEAIVQEDDGLLVALSDQDAFREALATMRKTAKQYDPMSIRARCLARFGRAVIAGRLLSLYRRVLG